MKRKLIRVEIPRELYLAIIRIQADMKLEFPEAAEKAASLIDANGEPFKQAVRHEAQRLSKSQFMKQLNTARTTIRNKAFQEGEEHVRNSEDNFRVPCPKCPDPIYFSSRDSNWEEVKAILYKAFEDWSHTEC